MSDSLPTVWPAKQHTFAKHAILRGYLEAWFPILSRQSAILQRQFNMSSKGEILFIDAFAGPGEYENGEPGSPIIALRTASQHEVQFPFPIRLLFIEKNKARFANLQKVIEKEQIHGEKSQSIILNDPKCGDCDDILNDLMNHYEKRAIKFGPCLAFMDKFGFSGVSMKLISRIMKNSECEIFTLLEYQGMNRFIQDESKADALTRAFGGDEWRDAQNLPETEQRRFLIKKYIEAIKARGNTKYVCHFTMFDQDGRVLYWLIFCTNSLRGLEEMKKAMWKVDKSGECRFSDQEKPDQLSLMEVSFTQSWLAEVLGKEFKKKTLTAMQVKEYVLTETPCHKFKQALSELESGKESYIDVINAPADRKRGSFPNGDLEKIEIHFKSDLLF
ncbi:MAG: three-Cys-motif partner protein TcmP [Planctomycetes bacterium]|nr:three-Cys-motif partner protein TcmP [Planctomycetota bacterium]